ncbi:MAG: DUF3761 domain-containing protein [Micropepsaceae bacterium]
MREIAFDTSALCGSLSPDVERIVAKAAAALREDYGRRACREAFERVLLMLAIDSPSGFRIWLHVGWHLAVAEGKLDGARMPDEETLVTDRARPPVNVTALADHRNATQGLNLSVLVLAACLGACTTLPNNPPRDGDTALCRDGAISYERRSSSVCAGHDGVARWLEPGHRRGGDREP